jgi:hypothetical protein
VGKLGFVVRRETERHSWSRGRRWLVVAVALLALGAPATAWATSPGQDQYQVPPVSATGSGAGDQGGNRLDPPAATGGSGSSGTTVAILAGGLAAIGAAAGIIVYRRRRGGSSEAG